MNKSRQLICSLAIIFTILLASCADAAGTASAQTQEASSKLKMMESEQMS